jgi:hypothetical protein
MVDAFFQQCAVRRARNVGRVAGLPILGASSMMAWG